MPAAAIFRAPWESGPNELLGPLDGWLGLKVPVTLLLCTQPFDFPHAINERAGFLAPLFSEQPTKKEKKNKTTKTIMNPNKYTKKPKAKHHPLASPPQSRLRSMRAATDGVTGSDGLSFSICLRLQTPNV